MSGAITAAAVGAAASIGGAMLASSEQGDAAAQAQAANDRFTQENIKLAGQARDSANSYQNPYYKTGTSAQNKLAYLMGVSNQEITPTDTSYDAYRTTVTKNRLNYQAQLQALKAKKPNPKNKKALAKWKADTAKLNSKLKDNKIALDSGSTSTTYQKWKEKQAGSITTTKPIDSTYGSLLQDYQEGYQPKEFTEKFTPKEFKFEEDPGYQFRKEQGTKEINNRLSAVGMYNSGALIKEADRFTQGLASQEYGNAFNRYDINRSADFSQFQNRQGQFNQDRNFDYGAYQDRINRYNQNRETKINALSGFAGAGQQAAGQMSQNENIYGSNVTTAKANQNQSTQSNINAGGNARSAGWIGAGNAISGGANAYVGYLGQQAGAGAGAGANISNPQQRKAKRRSAA